MRVRPVGRVYNRQSLNAPDRAWFHAWLAQQEMIWPTMRSNINTRGEIIDLRGIVFGRLYEEHGVYYWNVALYDEKHIVKEGSSATIESAAQSLLTSLIWYRAGEISKRMLAPKDYRDGATLRSKLGIN